MPRSTRPREPHDVPPPPDTGSVRPTPVRALVVAAIFGALAGWLAVITPEALDWNVPLVPWSAPVLLVVVGVFMGGLAWTTHVRLQRRHERLDSERAVRLLVLGKASALVGALVAAGYLVFGAQFVATMAAPYPRERVIRSAVSVVGGVGLCVAGLVLERACKVPRPPDERGRR